MGVYNNTEAAPIIYPKVSAMNLLSSDDKSRLDVGMTSYSIGSRDSDDSVIGEP
jgi:hypothetical protein